MSYRAHKERKTRPKTILSVATVDITIITINSLKCIYGKKVVDYFLLQATLYVTHRDTCYINSTK